MRTDTFHIFFEKANQCFGDSKTDVLNETLDTVESEASVINDDSNLVIDDVEQLWEGVRGFCDSKTDSFDAEASVITDDSTLIIDDRNLVIDDGELPWEDVHCFCDSMADSFDAEVRSQDAVHLEYQALHQFVKGDETDTLKLYIDDYQESTFDLIVESLYGNSTLKTLVVSRNKATSINYKTTMEMNCFWEAMRCCPHLETLILFNLGQDVLMDLGVALKNFPTLTRVQLHLSCGTICPPLLDALRTVPKLSHIKLEVHEIFDVGSLLTCPNLLDLRIMSSNKVALESQQIQGLTARIEQHPTLQSLDLELSMDTRSFVMLAQSLHSNQVLQSLRVSVSGDDDCKNNSFVVKELGKLMRTNSTLTHLLNQVHASLHVSKETMNNDILKALKGNQAIQHFMFFHENPTFWVAKEKILKRNRGNNDNKANGKSLFQKYWNCGSLMDINTRNSRQVGGVLFRNQRERL